MASAKRIAVAAIRNELFVLTILVPGVDLTAASQAGTLRSQIRLAPDTPGAPLINLATVTTAAAEGIKLDSVTVTNGVPTSKLIYRINKTTMSSAASLPYTGEIGQASKLAFAIQWDGQTRLYGDFWALASVMDSDAAPTDRAPAFGLGSPPAPTSSLTVAVSSGDLISVAIDGIDAVAGLATQANGWAILAQNWAQGTAPGGPGTKSAKEWSDTASSLAIIGAQLSQNWAEGTAPGGAGTKSAKEWAADALATRNSFPNYFKGDKGDPGADTGSVGPFSAVANMAIRVGTNRFQINDGGTLIEDATLTDALMAQYPLAITKSSNGRYFRRDGYAGLTLEQFGGVADGRTSTNAINPNRTDNLPALNGLLAYLRFISLKGGSGFNFNSFAVNLGPRSYYISDTVNLGQTVRWYAAGGSLEGGISTEFIFPANKSGIVFHHYASSPYANHSAAGSIVEGLTVTALTDGVVPVADTKTGASGFWLRTRVTLRYCQASYFAMDGFSVRASSDGNTDPIGNANLWQIENCTAYYNGRAGFYVSGADANAGTLINPNGVLNGQWAWFIKGFLINTMVGGHSASNGGFTGGVFPTTNLVFNNGKVYSLELGQGANGGSVEPGTNATVWRYVRDSSAAYPDAPQWQSGNTNYVEGGAGYLKQGSHRGFYTEGGQGAYYLDITAIADYGTGGAPFAGPGIVKFIASGFDRTIGPGRRDVTGPSGRTIYTVDLNGVDSGFVRQIYDSQDTSGASSQFAERLIGGAYNWYYSNARLLYLANGSPTAVNAFTTAGRAAPVPFMGVFSVTGLSNAQGTVSRIIGISNGKPTETGAAAGEYRFNYPAVLGGPAGYTFAQVSSTNASQNDWQPTGIVGAVRAVFVPPAAGATPTKAEFDALRNSLINAGLMAAA